MGIAEFELGAFTNTAGMEIAESRFKNIGRDSCLEILKSQMKKVRKMPLTVVAWMSNQIQGF